MKNGAFIVAAWIALAQMAAARSSDVSRIPNGASLSCAACHTSVPAVNSFGRAFGSNRSRWSASLASQDSDGDGFTNGQELGDPKGTGTPLAGARASSPGSASSKPDLTPPRIQIASPTNGASFNGAFAGPIIATSQDAALLTSVQFFESMNLLGTSTSGPFTQFVNLGPGTYTLTARAVNYLNVTNTSVPVMITVGAVTAPISFSTVALTNTGNLFLAWSGGAAPFTLQFRASLLDAAWQNLETTSNRYSVQPILPGTNRFYRVVQGQ